MASRASRFCSPSSICSSPRAIVRRHTHRPGSRRRFTNTQSWIDRVQKIAAVAVVPPEPPATTGIAVGKVVPDCALVDQSGREFRLSDLKGRALAFTFIFTRCPLPDFCPRMSEQFSAAQRELAGSYPAGRVQTIFTGNEWKPAELIDAMERAMSSPNQ